MKRTLIQEDTSAIIKDLIEKTKGLNELKHTTTKGSNVEKYVSDVFKKFLTSQFGIGKGIIINQKGEQSHEIDIIIYDKRLIPPFINEKNGVYPAEGVLAAIQVRSKIDQKIIKKYSELAKKLFDEIYNPDSSYYKDYKGMEPFYCLIGFNDKKLFKKDSHQQIILWMRKNAVPMFGVCLINQFSWLRVVFDVGSFKIADEYNEETKAFIGVLLDNIRTISQKRYLQLTDHIDWLGIYIRDQGGIKEEFDKRTLVKKDNK